MKDHTSKIFALKKRKERKEKEKKKRKRKERRKEKERKGNMNSWNLPYCSSMGSGVHRPEKWSKIPAFWGALYAAWCPGWALVASLNRMQFVEAMARHQPLAGTLVTMHDRKTLSPSSCKENPSAVCVMTGSAPAHILLSDPIPFCLIPCLCKDMCVIQWESIKEKFENFRN